MRTRSALIRCWQVEELLRFNGPVQTSTLRTAVETFEFAGVTLEAGDTVLAGLLAANRDTAGRPDAEVLDLSRSPDQHIAFGHGIHLCPGAPLATLEGHIALTSLLARFPGLRLAAPTEEIVADPGLLINALRALPVTTRPLPHRAT
jgi:cytochrome P450